jgi:hypothetical protein
MQGIRFVSKSERKKDSKKKSKDKKEKKSKRERYAHSSDEEVGGETRAKESEFNLEREEEQMNQLLREHEDSLSMEREGGVDENVSDSGRGNDHHLKRRRFHSPMSDDEENSPVTVDLPVPSSSFAPNDYPYNSPEPGNTSQPNLDTNQGFASLLRSRLKNPSTASEPLPRPATRANNSSTESISFLSKEEMKWMSSYTRRTSDKLGDLAAPEDGQSSSSRYKILDDREDDIDSILVSNILKKGSNFKGTELGLSAVSLSREGVSSGDRSGKDEGNENGEGEIDMKMLVSKDRKLSDAEIAKKILNKAQKTGKIFAQVCDASLAWLLCSHLSQIAENCSRCRNSRFYRSHRTICSGRHVELRIKPSQQSLIPAPLPHLLS